MSDPMETDDNGAPQGDGATATAKAEDDVKTEAPASHHTVTEAAAAEAASNAAVASQAAMAAVAAATATISTPKTDLTDLGVKAKRWTWKKPAGKPKRPLSAYNLFFADVRKDLMDEQTKDPSKAKLGFTELALHVSEKWKNIESGRKEEYERLARDAKAKYHIEIAKWKQLTANGTIRVGTDQDGRYLESSVGGASVAAAAAAVDSPVPQIPQVARCATCPACMALAAEQGLPEPNPIYIVASKDYVSQLLAKQSGISAADLAGEAIDAKAKEEEDTKKPAATKAASEEDTDLPTISLSVMPDGSIFHTRSDMRTLNQAKLQQDVTALWTQVRESKEKLRTKAASSVRHVPL